jgi:hypothetical protein
MVVMVLEQLLGLVPVQLAQQDQLEQQETLVVQDQLEVLEVLEVRDQQDLLELQAEQDQQAQQGQAVHKVML